MENGSEEEKLRELRQIRHSLHGHNMASTGSTTQTHTTGSRERKRDSSVSLQIAVGIFSFWEALSTLALESHHPKKGERNHH